MSVGTLLADLKLDKDWILKVVLLGVLLIECHSLLYVTQSCLVSELGTCRDFELVLYLLGLSFKHICHPSVEVDSVCDLEHVSDIVHDTDAIFFTKPL